MQIQGAVKLWEDVRSRGKWNNNKTLSMCNHMDFCHFRPKRKKKNPQSLLLWVELILEEGSGWRRKVMKSGAVKSFTWRLQAALLWNWCRKKKALIKGRAKKVSRLFHPWWRYLHFAPRWLQRELCGSIVSAKKPQAVTNRLNSQP